MTHHILILCTHNSARSALAEAMLNHWAQRLGRPFQAHSAGSAPSGRTNPHALSVLERAGIDVSGLRSKSWDEFAAPGAPQLDAVITVCDSAAAETCPIWPGAPVQVHWGYPDPSNAAPELREEAFELTRQALGYRMLQLLAVPWETLDAAGRRAALNEIAAR
ncbi:arsenate reductase ArsC [Inhella proteolytica]|uniref:Arsenate reductase ArsC n=1 Tax=Inhella proteolytica TaxID=2795029 RepID=A0A931J639_9BURK|nr:arsenate reductase ArsC [Inhella proteolytica]MBH9579443.1 arsenate reductase ArsC [Inhella proteolytica]